MKYGSVCSGIEAASVAWHPLGWRAAFLSEIESFPRAVLTHHYPDVPLHGDFTTIEAGQYDAIDLLVGGTPCQSFSVAGLRGGLADDRGNLALEYLRLADRLRPKWLVWENVPGVLSSNGGRDFGAILGGMVELGYGIAYRVLDAQFFGVPQRRRRVFVVGYLGDWRRAAAVLFERHSLQGHPTPRREAGQDVAPTISARPTGGGGLGTDFDCDGGLTIARCDTTREGQRQDFETETLIAAIQERAVCENANAGPDGIGVRTDGIAYTVEARTVPQAVAFDCKASGRNGFGVGDTSPTLRSMGRADSHQSAGGHVAVAFAIQERAVSENLENGPQGKGFQPDVAYTLEARNKVQAAAFSVSENANGFAWEGDVAATLQRRAQTPASNQFDGLRVGSAVRRFTPRECERLQGFPDDWTLVTYRNKPAADGPRYKALGNSMAVPVMRWIGERIAAVDHISSLREAA